MANATPGRPASDPNKVLLILAWVFAILFPLVGLILSFVGKNKGDPRFKLPLIVSIVLLAITVLWYVFMAIL